MRYTITTKGCTLSEVTVRKIDQQVKKLSRFLLGFDPEVLLLEIIIKKHHTRIHSLIDNPVYYDGALKLILPKKPLVAHLLGKSADDALRKGFHHLLKELKTYKGKHFKSNSEYFNQATIREEKGVT